MKTEAAQSPVGPFLIVSWIARLAIAGIYLMFAFQKIPYHANSQAIFEDIGGHPAALATAALEIVAAVLLFVPRVLPIGAALSSMAMLGAIATHILFIGISVEFPTESGSESDGGSLFVMAIGTFTASVVVLAIHREGVHRLVTSLKGKARPGEVSA